MMCKIFPYKELHVETTQKIVGPITFVGRHGHPFVDMKIKRHRITRSLAPIRRVFTHLKHCPDESQGQQGDGLMVRKRSPSVEMAQMGPSAPVSTWLDG